MLYSKLHVVSILCWCFWLLEIIEYLFPSCKSILHPFIYIFPSSESLRTLLSSLLKRSSKFTETFFINAVNWNFPSFCWFNLIYWFHCFWHRLSLWLFASKFFLRLHIRFLLHFLESCYTFLDGVDFLCFCIHHKFCQGFFAAMIYIGLSFSQVLIISHVFLDWFSWYWSLTRLQSFLHRLLTNYWNQSFTHLLLHDALFALGDLLVRLHGHMRLLLH